MVSLRSLTAAAAAAALAAAAAVPAAQAKTYFLEKFDADPATTGWQASTWKGSDMGKFEWTAGEWFVDEAAEKGIMTSEDMRWHATSIPMKETLSTKTSDLVLQFSAKHSKKEYAFCGGGYIKLLPKGTDAATFGGDSPYYVMFGPDLCGYDISRIHAIFNYNGENLLKDDEVKLDYNEKDEYTHVYTLVLKTDGSYQILFDLEEKASGKISEAWGFPGEMMDDPEDKKPEDWVDEAKIPDPEDVKPEGYDDIPREIPDPEATKPEDWDDEDDGEWEAPMVPNPEYKGPWIQKQIDNPDYKGVWKPKQIPNPAYDPATYAKYDDIGAVGFELWTVNSGSIFDNIYVGDSLDEAKKLAEETWGKIKDGEKEAREAWKKANEPEEPEEDDEEDVYGDDEDDDMTVEDLGKDEL